MIAYHIANAEPVQRQRDYQAEGEEWLMPKNATDVEPPDFNKETHTCSFNGTEWVVAEIVPDAWPTSPSEPQPDPSLTEHGPDPSLTEHGPDPSLTEHGPDSSLTEHGPDPSLTADPPADLETLTPDPGNGVFYNPNWEEEGWASDTEEVNALEALRNIRNSRLEQTDWWLISDRGVSASQAELDYRQALRDLPENNANVAFDENNHLINVNWPVKP